MWYHFIEVPRLEEISYYLERRWMSQDNIRKEVILEFTTDGFEADFWLSHIKQREVIHFWVINQNGWREKWGFEIPSYNQHRAVLELADDIARKIYKATHSWDWIVGRLIVNTHTITIEILDSSYVIAIPGTYLH